MPCPQCMRRNEKYLKRAQSKLAAVAKGTPEQAHRRRMVARIHECIRHRRNHFCHQLARWLVQRFDVLAVNPAYTS